MKKRIRLTESRFKRLVFETAKNMVRESHRRGKRMLRESENIKEIMRIDKNELHQTLQKCFEEILQQHYYDVEERECVVRNFDGEKIYFKCSLHIGDTQQTQYDDSWYLELEAVYYNEEVQHEVFARAVSYFYPYDELEDGKTFHEAFEELFRDLEENLYRIPDRNDYYIP